jgi:peptidylprolyl isomerase
VAAAPAGAERTASGLASRVLQPGKGTAHPSAGDLVTVEFTLWDTAGKVLDSTTRRPEALRRPLPRLIPGMREGIRLMVPGERRRFWIPATLASIGGGAQPIPLVMDLELVAFEPSPFQAPPDLQGSPEGAVLPSGLAYRVLRPGTGTTHPDRDSSVTVHYSGWTLDGKLFDSSWNTSQPITFRLDQVIKGWTEGLQLMVAGEKARFWIPEKLAYRGREGAPAGTLVFDVELLEIGK